MRLNGAALVPYKNQLLQVLDISLHLKCQEGEALSAVLLQHLLRSLTLIYALDYKTSPNDWNQPLDQYLPIRVCTKLNYVGICNYVCKNVHIKILVYLLITLKKISCVASFIFIMFSFI